MKHFTYAYGRELLVAQLAVQRAAMLTRRVFDEKTKDVVDKSDKSPVTIGDFGAQALIIAALLHNFPGDTIMAEEESTQLRSDPTLRHAVWDLVCNTRLFEDSAEHDVLGGAISDMGTMLELIDRGHNTRSDKHRIWTLDPIDGTKGFLRGDQYAICLGLIVDGDVKVGVLGCPNLSFEDTHVIENTHQDVLFSAVQHQGATSRPLATGGLAEPATSIAMRGIQELSTATFCESVEASHSAHDTQALILKHLGITQPSLRMDSQAKYASIACGAADIYLRLPNKANYQEKSWDHAAGDLITREAGGMVTDIYGKRLNFSLGKTLANNKGIVAAPATIHAKVLDAVQKVLKIHQ